LTKSIHASRWEIAARRCPARWMAIARAREWMARDPVEETLPGSLYVHNSSPCSNFPAVSRALLTSLKFKELGLELVVKDRAAGGSFAWV